MQNTVIDIHTFLFRIVVCIATLAMALTISRFAQVFMAKGMPALEVLLQPEYLVGAVFLAALTVPTLRRTAFVAPKKPTHALIQIVLGVVGASTLTFVVLFAAHAPLALWVAQIYIAPYVAIAAGISVILMVLAGIARAFVRDQPMKDDTRILSRVHAISASVSASFAVIIVGTICFSVLVVGRPTSSETIVHMIVMSICAVLLKWHRVDHLGLARPHTIWHGIHHIALVTVCLIVIERTMRAFLFHSGQFSQFADIDVAYPRFENAVMLPFIIFAMTGIALAAPPRRRAKNMPPPQEVLT